MYDSLFSRGGLSLERLRTLVEVGEAGSIAGAAVGDATRQSQYSRQLKELGEFFGEELTRLEGRNLKLTSAGLALARQAREILAGLEEFRAQLKGEAVTYAIGAGDAFIHWLLMPRLALLRNELPDIRFRFHNLRGEDILLRIQDRRLDFGIVRDQNEPSPDGPVTTDLAWKTLGRQDYAMYAAKSLLPEEEERSSACLLKRLPLGVLRSDSRTGARILGVLEGAGYGPSNILECESFPALEQAVRSGACAAILPTICRATLPSDRFAEVRVPDLNHLGCKVELVWSRRTISLRENATDCQVALCRHLQFK